MSEYAIRFYTLFDHAVRITAQRNVQALTIASYPRMSKENKKVVLDAYSAMTKDTTTEASDTMTIEADRKRLRSILGKK